MRGTTVARACNQRVTGSGRRVVDLIMSDGTARRAVPVMSGVAFPIQVPLESEVSTADYVYYPRVLVVYDEMASTPIVVGAMDNPKVVYRRELGTDAGTSGAEDPRDRDDDLTETLLEEARLDGAHASLVLRNDGAAVLQADVVSVQLPRGSYMRISEAGDTSERTMLSGPLNAKLTELTDKINELHEAVLALQSALQLVTVTPLTSLLGVQVAPPPALPSPVTGTFSIIQTPVYTGLPLPPVDEQALTAAALHISARSEADES